ncbi:MAG TPA: ExeM/NucH family extracellular endonuclease [Burkholderiaceae bacterium]
MQRATPSRLPATARATLALLAAAAPASASSSGVVISQVYGGNGNTYASDYVELFNAGASVVSLSGWSIQYASATGSGTFASNGVTTLNGTLQPGQHWLVRLATTTGPAIPTPDTSATAPNISASSGKLVLVDNSNGLPCNGSSASPCTAVASQIVDLVGYGSANYFEGAAAPGISSTTALFRANGGCTDTGDNSADFTAGAPAPRNSASPLAACAGGGGSPTATPAAIYQIQGNGAKSPYNGQLVQTQGVVTRVNSNGYFLQDLTGDNDPSTSDGVFVYTGGTPTAAAGQLLQLTATVSEFNTGAAANADTAAHTVTELTNPSHVSVLGTGYTIAPVLVTLPLASEDDMERYEGMLVTLRGPLTVQQNYFLGRFGELTLATGGRLQTPTNVHRPGPDANALNADNLRRSILLDDGNNAQDPDPTPYIGADDTVRAGDTVAQVTGVIDYGLTTATNTDPGLYKIHPTQPVAFTRANPRTAAADDVGGNVRVASANVENFFTTLDDGRTSCPPSNTPNDCRGANDANEFSRQRAKVVDELAGLNADVVALMELQNNGATAIQSLVDGLNAKLGAPVYARVPDAATGGGSDAIKVGMIYKPSTLALAGPALSDTAAINNRAPMAQTFRLPNGEKFNVIANHLKSKSCSDFTPGSGDADSGDLQGCFNARRVQQADELRGFVNTVQAASGTADTLLVGDFNAYAKEDPVVELTSNGFVDVIGRWIANGYSYVFNGTSGRLDQALATPTLAAKTTGATEWHINADEPEIIDYNEEFKKPACATCGRDLYSDSPYRASDHDPLVVGLNIVHAISGTAGRDTIVGTPGDDVITGGAGADTLTGNGGRDVFVYASMRDAADTITDFQPGDDRLDLAQLLASIGANPATALANRVVALQASGNNTIVAIAAAPGAAPRPLVTLLNVTPASIDPARDLGLGSPAALAAAAKTAFARKTAALVAKKTR